MKGIRNFALIGAAGYIAPRHLKAIKETGHTLVAALDKNDSVGILDGYFPDAHFFVEFERFDRHVEKLRRLDQDQRVHYVSIASPNYLHDAHIRFALRVDADAICEKPVVLNPWNIAAIQELEKETGRKTNVILQLRLHPSLLELKERIAHAPRDRKFDVELTYITSRGRWYQVSWKGNVEKSGGVATNIGVHFYDMLTWIFGDVQKNILHHAEPTKAAGFLELERARVCWFLSLDSRDLPTSAQIAGKRTYRSIKVAGKEVEFSDGFADLHVVSYREILAGNGFGLDECKSSIEVVCTIRNSRPVGLVGDYHHNLQHIMN